MADVWASGAAYEPYVGRWSRLVAGEFIAWLAVPPEQRWLDLGCGTGALTETILALASPSHVTGIDPSSGYVAYARQQVKDPRVSFSVGDAARLSFGPSTFQAAVTGLVLNFLRNPTQGIEEMRWVTKSRGTVAAYVWDYAGEMQLMRYFWNAAIALDLDAQNLDEGRRFPLCRPEPLQELFSLAGLHHVQVRSIDVPTNFRDFNDYWTPFLGGQAPAPGYNMSLDEDRRVALRERLRETLPISADGSIRLVARSWAVRGTV
jgi:SAM-dependent methyltransferase